MGDSVQSVIFDRAIWPSDFAARSWLALHGFAGTGKVHPTERFLRYRQREPRRWERYITKEIAGHPGVKLIVAVRGMPVRPSKTGLGAARG